MKNTKEIIINHKGTRRVEDEKINTDYKREIEKLRF